MNIFSIARERDELLALLDVTERMKYEQGKSMISEEEYGSFSSTELAVLGACKCRGANPEPCGCAHAAANLRKEIVKLREEIYETNKRRQEAYLTVDAYRLAFEEQMAKSRQMSLQLATMSTLTSRSVKAKAAMKFLLKSLSSEEEENIYSQTSPNHCEENPSTPQDKQSMTLQELVQALTDVVHVKEEALAQQKLAAQVLANKLDVLGKETSRNIEDPVRFYKRNNESLAKIENIENGSVGKNSDECSIDKTTKDEKAPRGKQFQEIEGVSNEDLDCQPSDFGKGSQESCVDQDSVEEDSFSEACCSIENENDKDTHHDVNRNEKEATMDFSEQSRDNTSIDREGKEDEKLYG